MFLCLQMMNFIKEYFGCVHIHFPIFYDKNNGIILFLMRILTVTWKQRDRKIKNWTKIIDNAESFSALDGFSNKQIC